MGRQGERLSFEAPSLPLFIHERLSTKAILETLQSHRREPAQKNLELFGDPQRPIADQILKPYEHGAWQNRMILGHSLVVMNSVGVLTWYKQLPVLSSVVFS